MIKNERYIFEEVKVIEKECLEKGISPIEWIERYAKEYHRKYGNGRKRGQALLVGTVPKGNRPPHIAACPLFLLRGG